MNFLIWDKHQLLKARSFKTNLQSKCSLWQHGKLPGFTWEGLEQIDKLKVCVYRVEIFIFL